MALVVDTGPLYALVDRRDPDHARCAAAVQADAGPLYLPALVLAEADYLIRARLGARPARKLLDDVIDGGFALVHPERPILRRAAALLDRFSDLDLGVTDATVAATAEEIGVRRILTLDERDFRALRSAKGTRFLLLPADADGD